MKLTGYTITDEQIRELNASTSDLATRMQCMAALRVMTGRLAIASRAKARARCAEILNARSETK